MSAALSVSSLPLRFQIGARTLGAIRRRLRRVPLSLDDALGGDLPVLPPLAGDGYLVTSLPVARRAAVEAQARGLIAFARHAYRRHYVDLAIGFDAWHAGLSSGARATLGRKRRKLAEADGGTLDVRGYRTPGEIAVFHPIARRISARTYQERLLAAGLPEHPDRLLRQAAADELRAWLLFVGGEPAAYLCCGADGRSLRYDHVGHDPAFSALSPGQVLQVEALRELFAEHRFARFDFTEGEGQHKRQLATGHIACIDLLLLRPTVANRATVAALAGFETLATWGKRAASRPALQRLANRVRR